MHNLLIVDIVAFASACTARPGLILDSLDVGAFGVGSAFPLFENTTIHLGKSFILLLW